MEFRVREVIPQAALKIHDYLERYSLSKPSCQTASALWKRGRKSSLPLYPPW